MYVVATASRLHNVVCVYSLASDCACEGTISNNFSRIYNLSMYIILYVSYVDVTE